jgi:hypothetical protein
MAQLYIMLLNVKILVLSQILIHQYLIIILFIGENSLMMTKQMQVKIYLTKRKNKVKTKTVLK